ncbi:hypothetical protein ACMA1I_10535 [Pontibacter sp. 13R65]|uniref:hypothetical protein n=1 Tax=Pontibacter sp. 13R65 TaxID=3127458 RepID=UPI00301DF499
MIIPNNLIRLEYNPVTDILVVEWPDIYSYTISEANHTLQAIINAIKHYDVKKLLIDGRRTIIGIPQSEYEIILQNFSRELKDSRLKMVARIESENATKELQMKQLTSSFKQKATIDYQSFASVSEALAWLEIN